MHELPPPPPRIVRACNQTQSTSNPIYAHVYSDATASRLEPTVPSDVHPAHAGVAAPVQSGD